MAKRNKIATGIAWYRREHYDQLRSMFADGDKLHATYDEWRASVQELVSTMEKDDMVVVRAYIDPDTFPTWCRENGFPQLDSQARSAWAIECVKSKCVTTSPAKRKPKRRQPKPRGR